MEHKTFVLRGLDLEDKKYLLKWNRDAEIRNLTGAIHSASELEHEKWFETKSVSTLEKVWTIVAADSKEPIGIVGLKNFDYLSRNAELYIYIGEKNYWGKGIGRQVTKEIVDYSFDTLNLHKVYLSVFSYNLRAIKMYKNIGFKIEGELVDSIYRDGKYHNKFLMGIIRSYHDEKNINTRC